jgi:hypothetical protein
MMVKLWRCETCRKEIRFRAKFRSNDCPAQDSRNIVHVLGD